MGLKRLLNVCLEWIPERREGILWDANLAGVGQYLVTVAAGEVQWRDKAVMLRCFGRKS